MRAIRWLHISDIHAGTDKFGFEALAVSLVDFLKQRKVEGFSPDILLFSGDIANTGAKEEYEMFNDAFLAPLYELYGNVAMDSSLFVPGNHDVDRSCHPLVITHTLLDQHPRLFDPTPEARSLRSALVDRFAQFQKCLPGASDFDSLFGEPGYFVRKLKLAETQIGIVGVNTAWMCQSDHDRLRLTPGRHAVRLGLQSISDCNLRIVLGHHPLSWLTNDEREAIEALLAQGNCLYLHGHLHEPFAGYRPHGAHEYLAIQSGAIFESRDSKSSPSSVALATFDVGASAITIEPFQWDPGQQLWRFAAGGIPESHRIKGTSQFHFPLPKHKAIPNTVTERIPTIPDGWAIITRQTVTKWTQHPPASEQILSYFDGRPPNWTDAASGLIPSRGAVNEIVNEAIGGLEQTGSTVILLVGPSGEGKSTALRQACCAVMRRLPGTRLVFRSDDEAEMPSDFVLNQLDTEKAWLIAADDAGNLAQSTFLQAQILSRNANRRVVFLLAARDTDWLPHGIKLFQWSQVSRFYQHIWRGINLPDAQLVVRAWAQYGTRGLQRLNDRSPEDAAVALQQASMLEEEESEGAFLGAMLRVRYGKDLVGHIELVLDRLQQKPSVGGYSLLDIFAAIVAMHRIGLRILDKHVLAEYFGIKEVELRRHGLLPLGDEAMVSAGAHRLLTRHKAIADAAYGLLDSKYEQSFRDIYRNIVASALRLYATGRPLQNLSKWRYVSRELRLAGEMDIAIAVAEMVVSLDPGNSYLVVHLASLHRMANRHDLALAAFRGAKIESVENRAFFTEWGTVEREDGDLFASTWLASLAIRDLNGAKDVTNDDAKMALSELVILGRLIFEKYNDPEFLELAHQCHALMLKLPLSDHERETRAAVLEGVPPCLRPQLPLKDVLVFLDVVTRKAQRRFAERGTVLPDESRANLTSFHRLVSPLYNFS